jgi:hypothetical protein
VIGVLEEKGNVGFDTTVDRQIIIPITTAMDKLYGLDSRPDDCRRSDFAGSDADIEQAKSEIKQLLRRNHKIRAGKSG